jgi:hypothetical protein
MTSLEELSRVCGPTRNGVPAQPPAEPVAVDMIAR